MNLNEKIAAAETHIFKAVFPNTTNHYDTLFGGTAMSLMDEVAFITATRFSRKKMVTVSSDRIDFTKAIPAGVIIELIGKIVHIGNTSLKVSVDIYILYWIIAFIFVFINYYFQLSLDRTPGLFY